MIFAFLDVESPGAVDEFFTEEEVREFRKTRYKVKKVAFPLVFEGMAQVASDQWIGVTSAKRLMELKDAQLIRYNANTQRTLKRVVRGEQRFYRISLNKKSVGEIRKRMESDTYIPDDITLNVPVGSEFTYSNGTLKITSMEAFDIIDGYHRYIAMSQSSATKDGFDYPMELRIVNFPEHKAQRFIFQKDQKTLMKRK